MRKASVALCILSLLVLSGCGESFWRELAKNSANPTGDLSKIGYAHGEQPPQVAPQVAVGQAPAPILKRVLKKKPGGKSMAVYITTNTPGSAGYTGTWTPTGDTYNSEPVYSNASGKFLYFLGGWRMAATVGAGALGYLYIGSATLPGTWIVNEGIGTAPAPTLVEAGAPVAGDSDPYGWKWPNNWTGTAGLNPMTTVAPCAATVGGVKYIVFFYNEITLGHGFWLFNPATGDWTDVNTSGSMLAWNTFNAGQSAGMLDAGDGEHVWLLHGGIADEAGDYTTVSKYSLIDGAQASTAQVSLASADVTNHVALTDGDIRIAGRDAGTLRLDGYTPGDAAAYDVASWAAGNWAGLPVGYTDTDAGLVFTSGGNLYYMRRAGSVLVPYQIIGETITALPYHQVPGGTYQTWGEYVGAQTQLLVVAGSASIDSAHTYVVEPGVGVTERASFVEYPAGRHWLVNNADGLYVAGWGAGGASGRAFVVAAQPPQQTMVAATYGFAAQTIQARPAVGMTVATYGFSAKDMTANEVHLVAITPARYAFAAKPLRLIPSADRIPAACDIWVRSVRVMETA